MKHILAFIARVFMLFTAWIVGVVMAILAAQELVTPREDYKTTEDWNAAQDNLLGDIARKMFKV